MRDAKILEISEVENEGIKSCNIGIEYYKLRQYEQALDYFLNAVKLAPDFKWTYYFLGSAYLEINCFDEAIENLTNFINYEPENLEANYLRGMAYFNKKEMVNAIIDFNKVFRLDPINTDADKFCLEAFNYITKNKISDLVKTNEIDEKINNCSEQINVDFLNSTVYLERALLYLERNELDLAIIDLEVTTSIEPMCALAYYILYLIYTYKKNEEKWQENLMKFFNLDF